MKSRFPQYGNYTYIGDPRDLTPFQARKTSDQRCWSPPRSSQPVISPSQPGVTPNCLAPLRGQLRSWSPATAPRRPMYLLATPRCVSALQATLYSCHVAVHTTLCSCSPRHAMFLLFIPRSVPACLAMLYSCSPCHTVFLLFMPRCVAVLQLLCYVLLFCDRP
ncbi:hypothetical protein E2C01_080425 [Portunus trituberculatus]|uniref:Uncharacterized protein n=1 Tax=Portunus trituberculatus TaxID=210409 RepID=A0A5B7ITF5_PORTR|nr:hypothetical protein [Portunus trituberculatus]